MRRSKGRYSMVKKPVIDGIRFDSGKEAKRYQDLKIIEASGAIRNLNVHKKYPITIAGIEIRTFSKRYWKTGKHLTYEADFTYWDCERKTQVIEDCKGHRTEVYRIKRALMLAMGHEILET